MNELTLAELPSGALEPAAAREVAATLAQMEPWRTLGYSADVLARTLANPVPGRVVLAIEARGQRLGLLLVKEQWLRGPYLELFVVFPGHQGAGVGQWALAALEARYRGRAPNLWLTVSELNTRARQFYARCGFIEAASLDGLVRDGFAEVLLRKRLADDRGAGSSGPRENDPGNGG